jgi:glycosyltransferase involved in cell wall biosynthesis
MFAPSLLESAFDAPLRVLFLDDTLPSALPRRNLHSVLKFLDPRLIHRTVVLARRDATSELLERSEAADEIIVEPNWVERPLRAARGFKRVSDLARSGAYDLIYCEGPTATIAGGFLAKVATVPALWHVRYTSVPRLVAPIHTRISASAGVRRIVCASGAAAAPFAHCREKVRIVRPAVDTEEFAPKTVAPRLRRELGISGDAIVFGTHGRVLAHRGYAGLLGAAQVALSRMTRDEAARAAFVVVGDAADDFFPEHASACVALSRALGIDDKVRFAGFQEDVRPYVADFDVAIDMACDDDASSILEAMAMGKPVISFDAGSRGELVEPGLTGTLVPNSPRDLDELAAQMLRYQRHPELRHRQGAAARAHAVRSFDARLRARLIQGEILDVVGET